MVARRVIIASSDESLGKQLVVVSTAAGGVVELHRTVESLAGHELGAALYVLHVDRDFAAAVPPLLPRLDAVSQVILVVPEPSLATIVDFMRSSDRIAGILSATNLDTRRLYSLAARLLSGELFGIDKVLRSGTARSGTQHESMLVHDASDRATCIAEVAAYAQRFGARQQLLSTIEQCLDEMLMNALYDAPVDERGKALFAGIPTAERVTIRFDQTAEVQYASDGEQFAMSVRDAFGSLDRATVLRVLHKCVHAEQKVDRRAGGAGVGLYLLASSATSACFRVVPGIATEVTCTFDLEASSQSLRHFGFEVSPTDVTGRLVSGRVPAGTVLPRPRRPRRRRLVLATTMTVLVAAGLVVAGSRLLGSKEVAEVHLDSTPQGAVVEIDGKRVGETPVTLTSLSPGERATATLALRGYTTARIEIEVPDSGKAGKVVPLALSNRFARVRFVTDPPGARVVDLARPRTGSRTYTPAEVFVDVDQAQRFVLEMPTYKPLVIKPFTPSSGAVLEKGGALVPLPK